MKIALYGKSIPDDAIGLINQMIEYLHYSRVELLICEPLQNRYAKVIPRLTAAATFGIHECLKSRADILISLGGDGTLLDTISIVRDSGIPIMGINLGRMGFLSSISRSDILPAIQHLLAGTYHISERSLLSLSTDPPMFGNMNFALNELTINKKDTSSMILIRVYIDDVFLHAYLADGLIVSTPTGSTAYSLSCSGPILAPDSETFVITPIATHNLTVRPVVISDKSVIRISAEGREGRHLVSLDSRAVMLTPDKELTIRKSDFRVKLVQLQNSSFFSTLREKLGWGHDIRN